MTNTNSILYYDRNGNPVYNPATLARMIQSGSAPSDAVAGPPDCFCGDARNYQVPSSFTIQADNTGGGAPENFKVQSFDTMNEAINGSMGTGFFTLIEAVFGNGTIALQNGTNIFGMDALRNLTATYALVISKMKASGTFISGTGISNFDLIALKGNLNRVEREVRKFTLAKDYQSQPICENNDTWLLTANKGFFVANIPNGANGLLQIEITVSGFKPYTELL
jgi:hypothetical protein